MKYDVWAYKRLIYCRVWAPVHGRVSPKYGILEGMFGASLLRHWIGIVVAINNTLSPDTQKDTAAHEKTYE